MRRRLRASSLRISSWWPESLNWLVVKMPVLRPSVLLIVYCSKAAAGVDGARGEDNRTVWMLSP